MLNVVRVVYGLPLILLLATVVAMQQLELITQPLLILAVLMGIGWIVSLSLNSYSEKLVSMLQTIESSPSKS